MSVRGARQALLSTEAFGALLFAFAAGFPPFDDATEVDLSLHMLQHFMIFFAGVLLAYPHYGRRLASKGPRGVAPLVMLLGSAVLVAFWHFPLPWDAAVLDPGIHVAEHLSFLLVGFLSGSWLLLLTDSGKIGALVAAFFGHMGYAVALIAPFGVQVYALYPLPDQVLLGWILLLSGPLLLVGLAYVVVRNPEWLGGYEGGSKRPSVRRATFLNRAKVPRWTAPLCTFLLVITFVLYLGGTAYALGAAQPPQGPGPAVSIVETPFSWQYSPQDITVVLGINSTVTWVSHSISYDTVTARGGGFDSGAIPPGGTYSHSFTQPGVYDYYCQFHPWMTGRITVLASP